MQVAQTILEKLGGRRFITMTGAKDLLGDTDSLQFRVGRNDAGVTHVRIVLTPLDTYTVTAYRVRGINMTEKGCYEDVYADNLRAIFTKLTGLETSL